MTFIPKNPLTIPEVASSPSLPDDGTRGLYARSDGWYDVDSDGNIKKLLTEGDASGNVDLSNYYTKEETDAKISSVYKYCGSVNNLDELSNISTKAIGDTYNVINGGKKTIVITPEWKYITTEVNGVTYLRIVENGIDITNSIPKGLKLYPWTITLNNLTEYGWKLEHGAPSSWSGTQYWNDISCNAGDNVAWTGFEWDTLSGIVDLSNYAIKSDLSNYAIKSDLESKQDISNMVQTISTATLSKNTYPSEAATIRYIDGLLKEKIDDSMTFISPKIPMASAVVNYVNDKLSSYETKTTFPDPPTPDDKGKIIFDFSDMYNKELRLHNVSFVTIIFQDNEYAPDYISGLSFDSGETATGFDYTNSGIINWVGTDCVKDGNLSIFQPSANTHYDIVFYFNGVQFIGLVNGFVPATGNVVSE